VRHTHCQVEGSVTGAKHVNHQASLAAPF